MTNESYESPDWVTGASPNYTVAEAARSEKFGIAWPISGDETTIELNERATK